MPQLNDLVPLKPYLPLNVGLSSATEATMISVLGRPRPPLTTDDAPDHASDLVKALATDFRLDGVHARLIRPAADSLSQALGGAFQSHSELRAVLRGNGGLVVRLRRPTSGIPSTKISNHAWGTAVDFALQGHPSPGATGDVIPYWVALLLPFFHTAGWYSGIAFKDDMHFEVADQTIHAWAAAGRFNV